MVRTPLTSRTRVTLAWIAVVGVAVGVRAWTTLTGPLMWGYDAWGHVAYALFLDLHRAVPWADQGWSYFHPPLHHALGWLLAQLGSGDVLMRGLPLWSGAASLGTALLAAWLVRSLGPERPWPPLVAFAAVAFLPVHLYMSSMPGNELTETFLAAAAITTFVANERRAPPTVTGAAVAGGLVGLALLTKFSGLLPLAVVLASLGLRALAASDRVAELGRCAVRGAVLAGFALLIASPYYLRNVQTFGTPFQLSRDFDLVRSVEKDQPPGSRSWSDYLRFGPAVFTDPNPLSPRLLHSVWGTVYLNVWADSYRESDVERALSAERGRRRWISVMAALGLGLTGFALLGAALAARDAWRGRRRALYGPLLLLAGATLGAFAIFSWRVPIWSALKASYLLGLSLPYGVFLARAAEWLGERERAWQRACLPAWLALVSAAAVALEIPGAVLPRRADAPAAGAVRFYFGEYEDARRIYGRLVAGSGYKAGWLDNLAAVELADGNAERALSLYARAQVLSEERGLRDPYREGRLAVATALAGDLDAAIARLDETLASDPLPELRANRGAIQAARGDDARAERDLRAALERAPEMVPAWLNLTRLLERGGRAEEAAGARAEAVRQACRGPRGYPYGLGTGEVLQWGVGLRWLLLTNEELRVAKPAFYRRACGELTGGGMPG